MNVSSMRKSQPADKKYAGGSAIDDGRIIFAGDKDFAELFAAFGFKVAEVNTREDFIRILESVKNNGSSSGEERCLIIARVSKEISDSLAEDEMERIAPTADVMFLSGFKGGPDINLIKAMYKRISERASGVDLTRKL